MGPMRVLTYESSFREGVVEWKWMLLESRWYVADDLKFELFLTPQGKLIEVMYKRLDPEKDPHDLRRVFSVEEISEMEVWI